MPATRTRVSAMERNRKWRIVLDVVAGAAVGALTAVGSAAIAPAEATRLAVALAGLAEAIAAIAAAVGPCGS